MKHFPVMLQQVLDVLSPKDGEVFVDATFGNGGYSEAILNAANCKVIAIDRDPSVLPRAEELKAKFGSRFEFFQGCFGDFNEIISDPVDGVVFDIGVSSMQLDQAERGFSFSKNAPLDMRMSGVGLSAFNIINETPEAELADLIYKFGEERKSRQIAAKIVLARKTKKIETTKELAEIIYQVIHKTPSSHIDPATRTFQAIRIAVNDELGELERGLASAAELLKTNGRMVVVSFHSLEDRIIKNFFNEKSGKTASVSRFMPEVKKTTPATFAKVSKAIVPSEEELALNKRSRSAKLRFAIKAQ